MSVVPPRYCARDNGLVGKVERHQCSLLDTGGGVADNVFETHFFGQFGHDFFYAVPVQGVFVTGLRRGQDKQVFAVFVFNQRLGECCFTLNDVD